MRIRDQFRMPPEIQRIHDRARRLEWITLGFMFSIVVVMYLAMGSSQAMKAAWIEDMLSLVAPAAFLLASGRERRAPTRRFPYGYHEAYSIAFLAGAVALAIFGAFILYDSVAALVRQDRPTIGTRVIFGQQVWGGWLMIAALVYSAIPPLVLGRLKLRAAEKLHDKALKADADMNRADWLTACAGVLGVLGIGLGLWWADAVAGALISVDIVRDGIKNLGRVVRDLMDERPTTIHGEESDLPERVRAALRELDWVEDVDVRFREEGFMIVGEAFVVTRDHRDLPARFRDGVEAARRVDWRVHDVVFTVVEPSELRARAIQE